MGSVTAPSIEQGNVKVQDLKFFVTESGNNLFGLDLCTKLGIVHFSCDEDHEYCATYDIEETNLSSPNTKTQIIKNNEDVFTGIGKIAHEYHIELTRDAEPVIKPARRIADSLKQPLRQELNHLLKLGIIREVIEPTEWVNDFVVITKTDRTLRLCLDPLELNKYIKRPHYYAKTLEDILPEIRNANFFLSPFDLRSGYWNILLDKESKPLTAFNTIYGRF
ncbi:hypothetical protein HOLleu_15504 [Holothuria leucospilota]|uniref:Reverse transcriptase domain-containing protein n=1 Tax=Holothuria leucospilota TaxID=206669 RepID=A0A9Q1H9M6_HOLLE|nr:hypothetical protein HOLleu_15504 [Holothuria leucospilota]